MRSHRRTRVPALLYILVLALSPRGSARTISVDDDGPADYATIQAAIDAAVDGDTVIVQPGTYTGAGNRDVSFKGKAITVRSTDPNDASIVASTVINCQGTETNPHRGFQFTSGEGPKSILAGLKITNGYGPRIRSGNWNISVGGAVLCLRSGPTIRNCQIIGNAARHNGGGIYCMDAETTIAACDIVRNTAQGGGGGLYFSGSKAIIDRCVIRGNTAHSFGGAISLGAVQATISNCLLATNMAEGDGGAVCCGSDVVLLMTGCTVADNIAAGDTGYQSVGGIDPDYPYLQNAVTLTNCIVWNNHAGGKCNRSTQISPYPITVLHSCVLGWATDSGDDSNTGADPLLTPDYHLQAESPCIDAGDPEAPDISPSWDIDGEPRVFGSRADIGCDEFVDADKDGLPDGWEVVWFDSVEVFSGGDNPDGDARENAQEYDQGGNPHFPSGICYVDPDHGDDSSDGLAAIWDGIHGPKATIQAAVDYVGSRDGDEVVLLPSIYSGQGNRDIDLRGKAVTVRGTDPNDPAVIACTTIDCDGRMEEAHRGFIFMSGETNCSKVEGLSVVRGWTNEDGGIIKCSIGSSPAFSNCVFSQGSAVQCGGAVYCGFYCNPVFLGCSIKNSAAEHGGGVYSGEHSSPRIAQCLIEANLAKESGGGIYTGGMSQQAGPLITGRRITGNLASDGGGILCDRSEATIMNCVVSKNTATDSGGAVTCWQGGPSFTNCTISCNQAVRFGGAFAGDGTGRRAVLFENCILWGNEAAEGDAIARTGCSTVAGCPFVEVVFCCLPDDVGAFLSGASYGWEIDFEASCFSADPQFVDWQAGDYRLMSDSPCIDVGTNAPVHGIPETDVDGEPRVVDGDADGDAVVDLGAHEFQR
ncbi:MAG: hypothetical protein KBE65_01940 [Phycisphaerae bacterium]|nr:hypothetical protein [Phycisphaerae bacterium]